MMNMHEGHAEIAGGLSACLRRVEQMEPLRWTGEVRELVGLLVESQGPSVSIGSFCEILTANGSVRTQVVGFRNGRVLSIPLEELDGVRLGDTIIAREDEGRVAVSQHLLGRIIDGFGKPIDDGPPIEPEQLYSLQGEPVGPLDRMHIDKQLVTGIRVIDSFLACGQGQRLGLFGGSGVGKSTLVGAISRNNSADVTVIALIGERNREVRNFLEHELSPETRAKCVVVVATSDRPAPLRIRACQVALSVAEYFRDCGKNVLLVMDSVTRLAMAQREIGLAAGEPPSQKGYTPSVFSLLPKIFERAGNFNRGSITAFFTVLVEGDDMNEPIADAVRGILDGHIVLSRDLATAGHYPAIDVLQSISRVMHSVVSADHLDSAKKVREALAEYRRAEDLIQLGAYAAGTNARLDAGIRARPAILEFLRQDRSEESPMEATVQALGQLGGLVGSS
jgi:flagellum-specific ATP synthase